MRSPAIFDFTGTPTPSFRSEVIGWLENKRREFEPSTFWLLGVESMKAGRIVFLVELAIRNPAQNSWLLVFLIAIQIDRVGYLRLDTIQLIIPN